jgi:hypothetical protein
MALDVLRPLLDKFSILLLILSLLFSNISESAIILLSYYLFDLSLVINIGNANH